MAEKESHFRIPLKESAEEKKIMTAEEIAEAARKRSTETNRSLSASLGYIMATCVKKEGENQEKKDENIERLYREATKLLGIKPPEIIFERPKKTLADTSSEKAFATKRTITDALYQDLRNNPREDKDNE